MGRKLGLGGTTVIAAALLAASWRRFGPRSDVFAFAVVWVPMTWLGTVSRVVQPQLPSSYHELRDFESDGSVYEAVGVRLAKRLLRRGPLAFFNPDLHLPSERTPEQLAHLEQRMKDAEATHAILLVATLPVALHAATRRWWRAAGLTVVFDVLMNGYPVMLQRYNRALLRRRFPPSPVPVARFS
ncbi:MAG TPA: hypothetical protein VLN74_11840 [Ilumatobacteraceae bacterium]|nr:hypothetical protein [Ilumatobacteraceae bacterium]